MNELTIGACEAGDLVQFENGHWARVLDFDANDDGSRWVKLLDEYLRPTTTCTKVRRAPRLP